MKTEHRRRGKKVEISWYRAEEVLAFDPGKWESLSGIPVLGYGSDRNFYSAVALNGKIVGSLEGPLPWREYYLAIFRKKGLPL